MSASTIAITTYVIAIFISFLVAGIIQVMGAILSHLSQKTAASQNSVAISDAPVAQASSSDDAAIAAVIAIAKNY
ncbi:hypothetical protein EDC14_103416 [Hydrogenispora ethanolica]|jgi:Na+-transporting methylmalonyl-CoA/oxaloacetate decarboxylase gamma subunit|uniref:Uncharacterized protein n=1 Tax=Hydrogenispora ethanolica TaxID=1082276 RepID=A0A4R1R7G3_HYDET|nr:hypothetical protein [Hydrogenispora ethanolica]TCL61460.1 hypothetical protein EDC14_103416 [Hydrogenispora ethanolica]